MRKNENAVRPEIDRTATVLAGTMPSPETSGRADAGPETRYLSARRRMLMDLGALDRWHDAEQALSAFADIAAEPHVVLPSGEKARCQDIMGRALAALRAGSAKPALALLERAGIAPGCKLAMAMGQTGRGLLADALAILRELPERIPGI